MNGAHEGDAVDLRVVKTRMAIEQAFIRLLADTPFERITVQNILDEALVNRKTFYSHYSDKYELADLLIEEQLAMLRTALEDRLSHDENEEGFPKVLREFYQNLLENRDSLLALMEVRTENHCLRDELESLLKEAYCQRVANDDDMEMDALNLDYLSQYYAATVSSSIRWFLATDDPHTLDVIEDVARMREENPAYRFLDAPFARKRG